MNAYQIRSHLARAMHQFGKRVPIGSRRYTMRGYYANRLELDGDAEPWMTAVLERALAAKAGAFVDVGVNTGQTLAKLLAIDPDRRYLGFEPQIGCCYFVDQFIRENLLTNATVAPVALANENRVCSLYSDSQCDSMATIVDATAIDGHQRRWTTLVPARVGDEVLDEIGLDEVAVVKIDVEGAELQVVSGLTRTLATSRPILILEVLPNFFGAQRIMQTESVCLDHRLAATRLFDLLARAGYVVNQINERDGNETAVTAFNLDDRDGFVGSNYTARPRS